MLLYSTTLVESTAYRSIWITICGTVHRTTIRAGATEKKTTTTISHSIFIDTLFLRRLIICIGVIDFSAQGRHNLLNFMDNFNICQNSIKSHTFKINFFWINLALLLVWKRKKVKLRVAAFQIIQMPNKFVLFSLKKELRVNLKCVFFSLGLYNRKKTNSKKFRWCKTSFIIQPNCSAPARVNRIRSNHKTKVK